MVNRASIRGDTVSDDQRLPFSETAHSNIFVPTPKGREAARYLFDKGFAKFPGARIEFVDVTDIKVQWGEAKIVEDSIEMLAQKFETRSIKFFNCEDAEDRFSRNIKTTTKRSIIYEVNESITSSNEFTIGVSVGLGDYIKFNTDMVTKNGISTSRREEQMYYEEILIDYDEQFVIPPRHEFLYTYSAAKGLVKALIQGRVVIDALLTYDNFAGDGSRHRQTFWTSFPSFLPRPEDRMVDYSGYIMNEGYENLIITKSSRPIEDMSVCDIPDIFSIQT